MKCVTVLIFVLCLQYYVSPDENRSQEIHGEAGSIEDYPYLVSVTRVFSDDSKTYCGGTILNQQHVLTAAQCIDEADYVVVRVGSNRTYKYGERYRTRLYVIHPFYDPETLDYDIGIVDLRYDVLLNGLIGKRVNLLEDYTKVESGMEMTVPGWGSTNETSEENKRLMVLKISTVSAEECAKTYNGSYLITSRTFCAAAPGKGTCKSDAGSPAITAEGVQVGVASFTKGCGREGFPNTFMDIGNHFIGDWIRNVSGYEEIEP